MLSEITYAGNKSSDHGLVIERFPLLNRPSRKYEKVSVPGRNGDIYFKQDAWNNYTQEYEVWSGSRNAAAPDLWANIFKWLYPEERGTTVEDILNLEVNGYHQLIDTYEPNTIRLAQFNEETEVENSWNNFGKSIIRFDCRPERFTADAFEWIDISEEQTTKSGDIVTFDPSVIIEAGQGKNKADVADTTVTDSRYFANLTDLTPSGTYTISFDYVRTGGVTIVITTSTFNYFPLTATSGRFSGTVTATAMGAISVGCHEITGSLSVSNFQCEEGTEATEYEPYELVADLDTAPYVQSLTAEINAVQNLNGYDKPWVGGSGKNKFQTTLTSQTVNGTQFTVNEDGSVTITGTPSTNIPGLNLGGATLPAGTYKATGCSFSGSGRTLTRLNVRYAATGEEIGRIYADHEEVGFTLTESADVWITSIVLTSFSGTATFYPMIRLATESDATWEPYENICPISGYSSVNVYVSPTTDAEDGTTYPISLGSTIYGGTLDVTNGVLTVDKGYVDLGSLDWTYDSGVGRFQATISDKRTDVALRTEQFMCSAYQSMTDGRPVAQVADGSIYNAQGNPYIYVHDSRFTSASAFKIWVSGYQLVYDLATSQTVTLTPTQVQTVLGQNNIWADSGTVEVVINKPILNETARTAKPCLKVYGSGAGTVYCNGTTITISDIPQYIYIDSDSQNCFKEISDANLNSLVSLSNGFPVLSAGGNNISWSGGVTNVEVMPRWWNL